MFIIVTSAEPKGTDVSNITNQLDKDNIAWFIIPANSEQVKDGQAVARFLSEQEFHQEFKINEEEVSRIQRESNLVEKWLKEHHSENGAFIH